MVAWYALVISCRLACVFWLSCSRRAVLAASRMLTLRTGTLSVALLTAYVYKSLRRSKRERDVRRAFLPVANPPRNVRCQRGAGSEALPDDCARAPDEPRAGDAEVHGHVVAQAEGRRHVHGLRQGAQPARRVVGVVAGVDPGLQGRQVRGTVRLEICGEGGAAGTTTAMVARAELCAERGSARKRQGPHPSSAPKLALVT